MLFVSSWISRGWEGCSVSWLFFFGLVEKRGGIWCSATRGRKDGRNEGEKLIYQFDGIRIFQSENKNREEDELTRRS